MWLGICIFIIWQFNNKIQNYVSKRMFCHHLSVSLSFNISSMLKSYIWSPSKKRENTLWYTTAFSSNPSSLRPVFSTTTELSSTSFTEFLSTPEFSSTSELSSNWILIQYWTFVCWERGISPCLCQRTAFHGSLLGMQGQRHS